MDQCRIIIFPFFQLLLELHYLLLSLYILKLLFIICNTIVALCLAMFTAKREKEGTIRAQNVLHLQSALLRDAHKYRVY